MFYVFWDADKDWFLVVGFELASILISCELTYLGLRGHDYEQHK